MLNLMLFGIGAAGNKAAIEALEQRVIDEANVKLINTTTKDIPEKYKNDANRVIKFSSMLGGCGKEPTKGQKAMYQAIKNKDINILVLSKNVVNTAVSDIVCPTVTTYNPD